MKTKNVVRLFKGLAGSPLSSPGRPKKHADNATKQKAYRSKVTEQNQIEARETLCADILKAHHDRKGRVHGEGSGGFSHQKLGQMDAQIQTKKLIGGRRGRVGTTDASEDYCKDSREREDTFQNRKRFPKIWGLTDAAIARYLQGKTIQVEDASRFDEVILNAVGDLFTVHDALTDYVKCQCGFVIPEPLKDRDEDIAMAHMHESHKEYLQEFLRKSFPNPKAGEKKSKKCPESMHALYAEKFAAELPIQCQHCRKMIKKEIIS